jgi:hypothetical protein
MIVYDIFYTIFKYANFKNKLRLKATCKTLQKQLKITDLYNINKKYLMKLSNNRIKLYPYTKQLKIINGFIDDINTLINLENLYISDSFITDYHISKYHTVLFMS